MQEFRPDCPPKFPISQTLLEIATQTLLSMHSMRVLLYQIQVAYSACQRVKSHESWRDDLSAAVDVSDDWQNRTFSRLHLFGASGICSVKLCIVNADLHFLTSTSRLFL